MTSPTPPSTQQPFIAHAAPKQALSLHYHPAQQGQTWQKQLAHAIRDLDQLIELLDLNAIQGKPALAVNRKFPLLVPEVYVQKMKKRDWNDPLLRQVLPLSAEHDLIEGFTCDPVGDQAAVMANGLLKKYTGRVLIITTAACAIHCRYCFRQHFPYHEAHSARHQWQDVLDMIAADQSLHEVILSGGDPLALSDNKLADLCQGLDAIPHVQRIRFHTRLPVVLPARINDAFLDWFSRLNSQKIMVIHANHANELAQDVTHRLQQLHAANAILLNQSVLLKGVNDSVEALSTLSEQLMACRVLPYYLHSLDKVQGAAHFEVAKDQATQLMTHLRDRLPGYMVPRFVQEVSGEGSKQPIF
ncbi:MAG: EF-P beta-lysylation protein EpmB [bacterium]